MCGKKIVHIWFIFWYSYQLNNLWLNCLPHPYQEYPLTRIDQPAFNLRITDHVITSVNHFFYSWKSNSYSPWINISVETGVVSLRNQTCSIRVWSSPGQYPWLLFVQFTNQLPPQWNSLISALCTEAQHRDLLFISSIYAFMCQMSLYVKQRFFQFPWASLVS